LARRKLLDDIGMYQASLAKIDTPPPETIRQTCATMREEGNKIASNLMPDIRARVNAALKTIQLNQQTLLGVLAEEPRACYSGLILQIHTEMGANKTLVTYLQ
jgi:hypothetical protein